MKRLMPFYGLIIIFCFTCFVHTGCKNGSDLNIAFDNQLDSVHMGVRLGMERQAFYDHCWDLNKQGKNITQGHNNTSVMHSDTINFAYPVEINFYPEFNEENKAYILPVRYEYRSWAPWNKEVYADKLLPEVISLMKKSYGEPFLQKIIDGKLFWYKYDSPRLITIYADDDHYVFVKFKNERYK